MKYIWLYILIAVVLIYLYNTRKGGIWHAGTYIPPMVTPPTPAPVVTPPTYVFIETQSTSRYNPTTGRTTEYPKAGDQLRALAGTPVYTQQLQDAGQVMSYYNYGEIVGTFIRFANYGFIEITDRITGNRGFVVNRNLDDVNI